MKIASPLRKGLEDVAVQGGFDRRKSLQDIEQHDWGEPSKDDTSLVTRCLRLRRKPLCEFTVGDLRIMIGQRISLPILIPLAVERLEEEPLAEGSFYPGDLLNAVFGAGEEFWASHPDSFQRVRKVVGWIKNLLPSLDEITRSTVLEVLTEAPRSLTE